MKEFCRVLLGFRAEKLSGSEVYLMVGYLG